MGIGQRIRRFREDRGLTLSRLAELADVSKGYLSALEREERENPSIDAAGKIATALGIPVSELIGEIPAQPEDPAALPRGLEEFMERCRARDTSLTASDIQMLRNIRYRGRQPETADDWAFIYETIRRTIG